mgnify:CR=1 FL=1
MPTIVFASPKGGAGKTTAALLLGLQLSKLYPVTIIDADPNHPISRWASGGNKPETLTVDSASDEDNILDRIEEAAATTPFVIVDLEGTASKIVLLAVSQADLVLIPTQGSELDASEASRAIRVVRQHEKMARRELPFAVLLTRTNPRIRSRNLRHIQTSLIDIGIPLMESELNEREAFKSVFAYRQTLEGLDPIEVANLTKAGQNVEDFVSEILCKLAGLPSEAAE